MPKDKKVIEIKSSSSVKDAVDVLLKNKILSAPVVDVTAKSDAEWLDKYSSLVDMMDVAHFVLTTTDSIDKKATTMKGGFQSLAEENKKLNETTAKDIAGISGNNPFVALDTPCSLRDAMILLGKHHLYRLVAIDGEKQTLVNVISQSAVIKVLHDNLSKFSGLTNRTLKELGLAEPKTVLQLPIHSDALTAFKLIANNRVGAIPIIGVSGNVIANISARDIAGVLHSPSLFAALHSPLSAYLQLAYQDKVDVMAPAITCHPTATLKQAIDQLVTSHIHRMYITEEKGKLISVLSLTDVIGVFVIEPKTLDLS